MFGYQPLLNRVLIYSLCLSQFTFSDISITSDGPLQVDLKKGSAVYSGNCVTSTPDWELKCSVSTNIQTKHLYIKGPNDQKAQPKTKLHSIVFIGNCSLIHRISSAKLYSMFVTYRHSSRSFYSSGIGLQLITKEASYISTSNDSNIITYLDGSYALHGGWEAL